MTATPQLLRFVWQMDADGRFTFGSNEFSAAVGLRTISALGRPWPEIAAALDLDPDGALDRAIASRTSFSAVPLAWPVDGTAERVAVEMSGFPVFDGDRQFAGHRGFGLCRDGARLAELAQVRGGIAAAAPSAAATPPVAAQPPRTAERPAAAPPTAPIAPSAEPPAPERPALTVVPPSENVVPFRATEKPPGLSALERRAFHEIARELTSRLGITGIKLPPLPAAESEPIAPAEPAAAQWTVERAPPVAEAPQAAAPRVPALLDRLPVGVLIYRRNQLIYANRAFLEWTGYESIEALATAGGLDRLFAGPGPDMLPETGAKTLAITTSGGKRLPVDGRLFAVPWDRESALALVLMLAPAADDDRQKTAELALRRAESETRELVAILDTATDGVIVLDREGHLLAGNRSAEALFGYDSHELTGLSFGDLFAPESQRTALDYLDGLDRAGVASVLNDGREVIGRVREGGLIPLFMTMGRVGDGGEKFCAVFRDITQWKKAEEELINAKREAEKTSSAKSDFLAKISHEIRTPLNSIIGFSEVMMEERFGPIGNERYKQYLKDINSSGAHVVSLINDLLDLSKIEAGKLELNFTRVDLNVEIQQCVAIMQPQANRQRIIIRTSLAPGLPPIVADARSMRQIVLNLLSNSIKFTAAGGQVIVSTALSEQGEVILRVRDTGVGMSEQDIAVALEPFRQLATSARAPASGSGLGLPLTKALAEANRASFAITSRPNSGTLIEILFPSTRVLAE
jgi:PAS domain S-box-containing protein